MSQTTSSTTTTTQRPGLRELPLSQLTVAAGFNPRQQILRDREYEALVATVRERGILQPIRVRETGTGDYVVTAGHRRHAAAIDAALTLVPCVVLAAGAGDAVEEAELRVDALIENDVRAELSPLDRASAYQELKRGGLTVRGIAERLHCTQARVREHLAMLELPEALQAGVGEREIPLHAVRPLLTLARIHPKLAELAAGRIRQAACEDLDEPLTWAELAEDPIEACLNHHEHLGGQLPAGVYQRGDRVPLEELPLAEKATKAIDALAKLEHPVGVLVVDRELAEHAQRLGAWHPAKDGWHGGLIVGTEILAQHASDALVKLLKEQRKLARERKAAAQDGGEPAGSGGEAPAEPVLTPEQREEQAKAQRALEREAELASRAQAERFNDELATALLTHLAKVKVEARVMQILLSVDLAGNLGVIAMRGARYGFPGWPTTTQTTGGKSRRSYLDAGQSAEKAREYLAGAKTPGEHAGRALTLIAMASLADQEAVAMSSRVGYELVAAGTPWAPEAIGLLDELVSETLKPTGVLQERLAERARARVELAERRARQDQARRELEAAEQAGLDSLEVGTLRLLLDELEHAYEPYHHARYRLDRELREAIKTRHQQTQQTEPQAAGEPQAQAAAA